MNITENSYVQPLNTLFKQTQNFANACVPALEQENESYSHIIGHRLSPKYKSVVKKFFNDALPPMPEKELSDLHEKVFSAIETMDQNKLKKTALKYFKKLSYTEESKQLYINSCMHKNLERNLSKVSSDNFLSELEYRSVFIDTYKTCSKRLEKISSMLEQLVVDDSSPLDKEQIALFRSELHSLNESYGKILGLYQKNNEIDLIYANLLGNINYEFRKINDLLDCSMNKFNPSIQNPPYPSLSKKSVFILTCSFGTGHKSTAAGIAKALENSGAHAKVCDFSTDVFLEEDTLYQLGKFIDAKSPYEQDKPFRSVDAFTYVLKNQQYESVNLFNRVDRGLRDLVGATGKHGVAKANPADRNINAKQLIRERFLIERPDQIVTTYHMDLNLVLEVAKELGIPVLHVPTDYNMKCNELFDECPPDYDHFKMLVPSSHPKFSETGFPLKPHQLVKGAGIPLRAEFYKEHTLEEISQIKSEKKIPAGAKIVLTLSGGHGQSIPFPEKLANSKTWKEKVHIIVIAGGNKPFAEYLKDPAQSGLVTDPATNFLTGSNKNVTIEIAVEEPKTAKKDNPYFIGPATLSTLMEISDSAISKAGGISVAELVYKQVPILFDRRKVPFSWEDENIEAVTSSGRGVPCNTLAAFEGDLTASLALGKKKSRNFCYVNTLDVVCEQIAKQQQIAEEDPSIINKRSQYGPINLSQMDLVNRGRNDLFFDVLKSFVENKKSFSVKLDENKNLSICEKNIQPDEHAHNIKCIVKFLSKEFDAIKSSRPYENPLTFDRSLSKKFYTANLYIKQVERELKINKEKNSEESKKLLKQLTGFKDKIAAMRLEGEAIAADQLNKAGIAPESLVSAAASSFLPYTRDDPAKWGKQYVFEIVTGTDKENKETHSWVRLKTPDGKIFSHGLYGESLKGLQNLRPYKIRQGTTESPDHFDLLEKERVDMAATPIAINAKQFELVKKYIEETINNGVPFNDISYNSTTYVRALAHLIDIDLDTKQKISSFGAKNIFNRRLQRIQKRGLGEDMKKVLSSLAQNPSELALTILGGKAISGQLKNPELINKTKSPFGYTDSPMMLYKWHEAVKNERRKLCEALIEDISSLTELLKSENDKNNRRFIEKLLEETRQELSQLTFNKIEFFKTDDYKNLDLDKILS